MCEKRAGPRRRSGDSVIVDFRHRVRPKRRDLPGTPQQDRRTLTRKVGRNKIAYCEVRFLIQETSLARPQALCYTPAPDGEPVIFRWNQCVRRLQK